MKFEIGLKIQASAAHVYNFQVNLMYEIKKKKSGSVAFGGGGRTPVGTAVPDTIRETGGKTYLTHIPMII